MAGAVRPRTSTTTPTTAKALPTTMRRWDDSPDDDSASTRAATGGIRTARRAGLMADTRVTPTPTSRATTTVRGSMTREPDGSVMPRSFAGRLRPMAASTPRPSPTTDATSPVRPASSSTDRKT